MDNKSRVTALGTHFPSRKYLLRVLLLCGWSFFQYRQGNELYAVFVPILFILLTIPRLPGFTLIAAFVLVTVLFKTSVLDAGVGIRTSNLNLFQSYKPSLSNLFTPDSGRRVLPRNVQRMLSLLEANNITEYRLSASFEGDPLISQRIVESAWPRKKEAASGYILAPIEELEDLSECTRVDALEDVALVHCP